MTEIIKEPEQRISPAAIKVWRIRAGVLDGFIFIALGVLLYLNHRFDWAEWLDIIFYILLVLAVIYAVYNILIRPIYLQRTWRYEIDEEHIQLKHGALRQSHLIVPMTKVQYVETNQGPLLRKYKLRTITIGTMASSHDIPALPEQEATKLRSRIAFLAEITDDEAVGESL